MREELTGDDEDALAQPVLQQARGVQDRERLARLRHHEHDGVGDVPETRVELEACDGRLRLLCPVHGQQLVGAHHLRGELREHPAKVCSELFRDPE
jgi:hypothetical protein